MKGPGLQMPNTLVDGCTIMVGLLRKQVVLAIALAAILLVPARGVLFAQTTNQYQFEVPLSPYCLNGSFPISVVTEAKQAEGALTLSMDSRGQLTGQLELGEQTYVIRGRHKHDYRRGLTRITIQAIKTNGNAEVTKAVFSGMLQGTEFVGLWKGFDPVAPGPGTFSLDVATASPLIAAVDLDVVTTTYGSCVGTGNVTACGNVIPVRVRGVIGSSLNLSLKGRWFTFRGFGPAEADGSAVLDWSAKSFGATAIGTNLAIIPLPTSGTSYQPSSRMEKPDGTIGTDVLTDVVVK